MITLRTRLPGFWTVMTRRAYGPVSSDTTLIGTVPLTCKTAGKGHAAWGHVKQSDVNCQGSINTIVVSLPKRQWFLFVLQHAMYG